MAALGHGVGGPESEVLPASIAQDSARELSIDSLVADHYGFVWRVLRGFGLGVARWGGW